MPAKLRKIAPVGANLKSLITEFIVKYVICLLFSSKFFIAYASARNKLFILTEGGKILRNDAKMPFFSELFFGTESCYIICIMLSLIAIFSNYMNYRSGSHSYYTMKRLPDPREIHIRAIAIPLIEIIIFAASMALVYFISRSVYINFTPAPALPI